MVFSLPVWKRALICWYDNYKKLIMNIF